MQVVQVDSIMHPMTLLENRRAKVPSLTLCSHLIVCLVLAKVPKETRTACRNAARITLYVATPKNSLQKARMNSSSTNNRCLTALSWLLLWDMPEMGRSFKLVANEQSGQGRIFCLAKPTCLKQPSSLPLQAISNPSSNSSCPGGSWCAC